jgi:hypothetical protein
MTSMDADRARQARMIPSLTGWSVFAGTMLVIIGAYNLLSGFTALDHGSYFGNHIVYSNLTFWGWAFLIWGALQLVAGGLVFARHPSGHVLGVSLATVSAMLWFFMIFASPWNAFLGVTTSFLVIYGLTVGSDLE